VAVDKPTEIFAPDKYFVRKEEVLAREDLPIQMEQTSFQVNGTPLEINNVPKQARVIISVLGQEVLNEVLNDTKILLESPTPGFFDIRIEMWPYLPWTRRVEAVL
jgi:hypothetical protein